MLNNDEILFCCAIGNIHYMPELGLGLIDEQVKRDNVCPKCGAHKKWIQRMVANIAAYKHGTGVVFTDDVQVA